MMEAVKKFSQCCLKTTYLHVQSLHLVHLDQLAEAMPQT